LARTCVRRLLLTSSSVRLCSVPTASGSALRLLCASVSVCSCTTSHHPVSALGAEKSITTSRERLVGSAVVSTAAGTWAEGYRLGFGRGATADVGLVGLRLHACGTSSGYACAESGVCTQSAWAACRERRRVAAHLRQAPVGEVDVARARGGGDRLGRIAWHGPTVGGSEASSARSPPNSKPFIKPGREGMAPPNPPPEAKPHRCNDRIEDVVEVRALYRLVALLHRTPTSACAAAHSSLRAPAIHIDDHAILARAVPCIRPRRGEGRH
jgi:hypothetical protein